MNCMLNSAVHCLVVEHLFHFHPQRVSTIHTKLDVCLEGMSVGRYQI